jgi:hypothetical protein
MKERVWVFIGYSSPDEEKVEELYHQLSAAGFRPWSDGHDLLPGDEASVRVRAAVRGADFFLACLSNNSVDERGNAEPKLNEQLNLHLQGTQTKAFLIPVRLEECRVPKSIDSLEHVDLFKDNGWPHLLESINTVVGRRNEVEDAWAKLMSESDVSDAYPTGTLAELTSGGDEEGPLDGPADKSSIFSWGVDLRRLISGQRELSLINLGGVEEYIEMNLEEADDRETAKQAFDEALGKLVQTWQPSVLDDGHNIAYLLDLIKIFTPPGGFVKVVEFIQRIRQFAYTPGREDMVAANHGLLRNALGALESYCRVPPVTPEDRSPAYETYLDLLREGLRNPQHNGYALKRLIELKVISLKSVEIKQLIEKRPAILIELVNLLLDPNRRSDAEDNLTNVLTYCLNIGDDVVWEFEQAIAQCGGEIEDSNEEERPIRIIYGGEELQLNLSDSDKALYKFQQMRWRRTDKEGFDRLAELTNA